MTKEEIKRKYGAGFTIALDSAGNKIDISERIAKAYSDGAIETTKELQEQILQMKCCGNCYYFDIDKNIGIGNLFCNLMLIKKEYCKNKDHWKFLRR